MSGAGILEIQRLSKRFDGTLAVDDVSFTVRPGEILGYIGPNGAGKSTTIKSIIGMIEPSDGRILYQGRSVIDDLSGFQRRPATCRKSRIFTHFSRDANIYNWLDGCADWIPSCSTSRLSGFCGAKRPGRWRQDHCVLLSCARCDGEGVFESGDTAKGARGG